MVVVVFISLFGRSDVSQVLFRMPVLAFSAVHAVEVRTRSVVVVVAQKLVERWTGPAERSLERLEFAVDERVGEHLLLDHVGGVERERRRRRIDAQALVEVVVRDDDALLLVGELEHLRVVVALDESVAHASTWHVVHLIAALHLEQTLDVLF